MQRREFLQNMAWLAGGLVTTAFAPVRLLNNKKKKLKGQVHANGKGIAGVVVSDGYNVVMTDSKGKYEFKKHPEALALFVSMPPGYAFKEEKGIARHYLLLDAHSKDTIDFEL